MNSVIDLVYYDAVGWTKPKIKSKFRKKLYFDLSHQLAGNDEFFYQIFEMVKEDSFRANADVKKRGN